MGGSHGDTGIVSIIGERKDEDIQRTIAHEVGHATKHQFPRQLFGPDDHTPDGSGGIMTSSSSNDDFNDFSENENYILRGRIIPQN